MPATNNPEDDSSTDTENTNTHYGIGSSRRRTLEAINEKPTLDEIDNLNSISDLTDALQDIAIDGYSAPPEETIEKIKSIHGDLPEDAKPHFLTDDVLIRRINTARRQFETYKNRLRRVKEMPSPVEAGPAKYPEKKAEKRVDSQMNAAEELDEKIDRVKAGASGARQRALNAIGSSIAEQNENDRESTREKHREQLEAGDLVAYRNPQLYVGEVIRVNQKSVRVRRPNPRAGMTLPMSDEPEPDFKESREQLDSEYLTPLFTDEDIANLNQVENIDADTITEAREQLDPESND